MTQTQRQAKAQQGGQEREDPTQRLRAQVEEQVVALQEEMAAGRSQRLEALLTFASRFWRYSAGNQLLIHLQCPEASYVAGYRTWERLGYHVAKGQRSIHILAPRVYVVRDDLTDEVVSRRTYFRDVSVFDVSQLSADEVAASPLPSFYYDLGGDDASERLAAALLAAMRAAGIVVEERDDLGGGADGTRGYSAGGRVAIRTDLSGVARCRTLAHEYGHELLHHEGDAWALAKTVKECHAEATAYVVLAAFGFHNPLASDYLQLWGATPDLLAQELGEVQRASAAIIGAVQAELRQAGAHPLTPADGDGTIPL